MAEAELTMVVLAREMYLSYGEVTAFRNHQGLPMPSWPELGSTIQGAWVAAATTAYHLSRGIE